MDNELLRLNYKSSYHNHYKGVFKKKQFSEYYQLKELLYLIETSNSSPSMLAGIEKSLNFFLHQYSLQTMFMLPDSVTQLMSSIKCPCLFDVVRCFNHDIIEGVQDSPTSPLSSSPLKFTNSRRHCPLLISQPASLVISCLCMHISRKRNRAGPNCSETRNAVRALSHKLLIMQEYPAADWLIFAPPPRRYRMHAAVPLLFPWSAFNALNTSAV